MIQVTRLSRASPRDALPIGGTVAHAITTHRAGIEDDYFTAVDDLRSRAGDTGAGFLDDAGFGSGVYYLYVCIDNRALLRNLDGATELAQVGVHAFVEALAAGSPKGRRNGYLPVACACTYTTGGARPIGSTDMDAERTAWNRVQRSVSRGQPRARGAPTDRGAEQSAVALRDQGDVVLRRVIAAMTYLTRARLNLRASGGALTALLCPRDADVALDIHHRLIWSLFPVGGRRRDFLWRATRRTEFLVLSRRRPCHNDLFEPVQVKTFEPNLAVGDRLQFALRVNATKHRLARRAGQSSRTSHRTDIVTDALLSLRAWSRHVDERGHVPETERRAAEKVVATRWLARQGEKSGFTDQYGPCPGSPFCAQWQRGLPHRR